MNLAKRFYRYFFIVCILLLSQTALSETGENSYMLECLGCHAVNGNGATDVVPSLNNEMANFLQVEGGREYLVQVPGSAQSPLSDQELADTLNWMLQQFGPIEITRQYPLYTTAEVASLRKAPLMNVDRVRASLTEAIAKLATKK